MPTFKNKLSKKINGFKISVYEVDLGDPDQLDKLKAYIKAKIKSMKIHNSSSYIPEYLNAPTINAEFKAKLIQRIQLINTPGTHSQAWFDVRRSRVTEFMSQLLLEKEYSCIFYEEADKRINVTPINVDKHAPGIDVPGILPDGDHFKFVVCEVKASKSSSIPCSSATDLCSDIKKSYDNKGERLSKEILDYFNALGKGNNIDDQVIQNVLKFLINLIHDSDSQEKLLNNVIFFPFLIRNNPNILAHKNLDDFKDFNNEDLKGSHLKGIIWSFNKDIDSFCNSLYDEVLAGA